MSSIDRLALLVIALTGAACQLETHKVQMAGAQLHENGLVMPVPEGFEPARTDDGFNVSETGMLRHPQDFKITLLRNPDQSVMPPPAYLGLFGPRERVTADKEGGSGGIAHHFEAWRPLGICWVVVHATSVSETGTPSFLVARAVWQQSSVRSEAKC